MALGLTWEDVGRAAGQAGGAIALPGLGSTPAVRDLFGGAGARGGSGLAWIDDHGEDIAGASTGLVMGLDDLAQTVDPAGGGSVRNLLGLDAGGDDGGDDPLIPWWLLPSLLVIGFLAALGSVVSFDVDGDDT